MSTLTATAQNMPITPNFRTNADQWVRFAGHGEYLVKYLGKCPVSGVRLYDMPGAGFLEHQADILEAADYGMTGPDFYVSWLACNNDSKLSQKAKDLARKTWLPTAAGFGPVKAVVVRAVTWFDKVNANPYYRATIYANGERVLEMPRQYGSPDSIKNDALSALDKAEFIEIIRHKNYHHEYATDWAKRAEATFEVFHHAVSYNEYKQRGQYAA